ncbi:hypothetical protein [Jannaschia pohangensis]|uniref:Outer membrane protein beta-barrel family protein n=1 Tax=Jannaschia pohangensis TaxID=390807 RepID=A0A1I3TRB1_9RHOB|nr:hypothetical protein [Jannaschia pohangensis]SFJ73132.1 hypothetical protein SAMN04488095_3490 [Jannaschia pohangensis]
MKLATAVSVIALMAGQAGAQGFALTLNGDTVTGSADVAAEVARVDRQLQQADVRVQYSGLAPEARLTVEVTEVANGRVRVQTASNFPAFIVRGELRLVDRAATAGPRVVSRQALGPNGAADVILPSGVAVEDLVLVYRVYDAQGRWNETEEVALAVLGDTVAGVERGSDITARRGIPIRGGAVRVSGSSVAPGAVIETMGEAILPDPSGDFVVERILPPGSHPVRVAVNGAGAAPLDITRDVDIPTREFFGVGTADLTFGLGTGADGASDNRGRLAFFIEGRTAGGVEITASADTGEEDLDDLFKALEERDPREVLQRIDPRDLFPTYGDDSTLEDRTPSSGRLFLRVEKDRNYLQWGDFAGNIGNNSLVRNERQLYGLQVYGETPATTSRGLPRASVSAYAASPDRLPQRDLFQGTGGSVYFLRQQDVAVGTEILTVQLRDPDTGRVIETRRLEPGQDYRINHAQGIVTLDRPLSARVEEGLLGLTGISRPLDVVLAVQYEYTPNAFAVTGETGGARVEAWVTDDLRFGVAGIKERTGGADQTLTGADLLWVIGEDSFLSLEVAESDGPGFGEAFSPDGGLAFETDAAPAGSGSAYKAEFQLDFRDAGLAFDGALTAYAERREEGFNSLDFRTTAATGDERLWGVATEVTPRDGLTFALTYDDYENDVGEADREGSVEAVIDLTERFRLGLGLYHEERRGGARPTGTRTNAAARLTYAATEDFSISVFGQGTLSESGLGSDDRLGAGFEWSFAEGWALGVEASDGSLGPAADVLLSYGDEAGNTRYLGWVLDPERTVAGTTLRGSDKGRIVTGGRQRINDRVTVFGENIYDVFGDYRTLTQAYGVDYAPHADLSTTLAFEIGRIDDRPGTDLERRAVSLGATLDREFWQASGRLEFRDEEGLRAGTVFASETIIATANVAWEIDASQRLVFSLDYADVSTDSSTIISGDYTDVVLGYAYRPVTNDRLNVLARYRFLDDGVGQRIDGVDDPGPRQRSHIASVSALYDVSPGWTLGGSLAYRAAQTSAGPADPFIDNDAWLGVASVRWHALKKWDVLLEARQFEALDAQTSDTGFVATGYRQINENYSIGLGYNFGTFSDDLTDLVQDDEGLFINLLAQF